MKSYIIPSIVCCLFSLAFYFIFVREPAIDSSQIVSEYFNNIIVAVQINPNSGLSNSLGSEREIGKIFTDKLSKLFHNKFPHEKISIIQITEPYKYKDHPLTLDIQLNIDLYGTKHVVMALDIHRGPYYAVVKEYSSTRDLNQYLKGLTENEALLLTGTAPHSPRQIKRRVYPLTEFSDKTRLATILEDFAQWTVHNMIPETDKAGAAEQSLKNRLNIR